MENKASKLQAAAMENKASNYTNKAEEFLSNNPDLLDDEPSRPNQFNSLRMCPVQISQLPEITEETLPKWEEMEKN